MNVKGKSTFLIDGTNRGYVHSPIVYVEDSLYTIQNCTNNASNGGTFTAIRSEINFKDNAVNGLSATNLTISDNSTVICDGNGGYGIAADNVSVDGTSTVQVTNNATMNGFAGFMIRYSGTISKGATVIITGNQCKGLYLLYDSCEVTIEEGVDLTITDNYDSNAGGGIRNQGKNLSLPSNAVIFNNHAANAGDDIYCSRETSTITFGKVGSDWKLDGAPDCNHAITGWFDDSKDNRWNVHTGPVHAELYDEFDETTGLATVTGLKALKAAHPYQYDPDAPTEPSEPVDWETSKSKTATNLDKNYESQVTLSLPAAETVPVTDVVFVLDRSSSAGAARQEISSMMDNLLQIVNNSDAVINVGVVNFWYEADSGIALTALTNESIDSIKNAIMEGNLSGTNIEAGIDAAVAMLDASSTPDENKYMVLVTDGISHAWNDQNGEVKTIWGQGTADYSVVFNGANSYYYFDTTKTSFQTVFDTPSGDTQLNSNYEVPVFDAESVIEVLEDTEYADYYIRQGEYESYYSGVEKGVYEAAHAYANAASKYKCINLYWEVSGYPIASEFMEWTNEQGKCYNISDDLSGAFDEVEREITYVVDAGSQVIDVIGGDDDGVNYDYDFDFVDVVSLTVGGEELDFTKDGNTYYFGESRDGIYPFVLTYYPNGLGVATMDIEDETVVAGELFVWEINVPITIDKSVQLTYTVKLANPKTADGTYGQYDEDGSENYAGLYTNNSAVLFPVDSNGNVGEKEAFDKPTVSYTVSNGKPVEPTPDPDPDPDRPSRPNRDDDDDWEPLPDAPVKDKPTTEVDVPEETETPTTEQPDKYNPETGDTTTVFAAMLNLAFWNSSPYDAGVCSSPSCAASRLTACAARWTASTRTATACGSGTRLCAFFPSRSCSGNGNRTKFPNLISCPNFFIYSHIRKGEAQLGASPFRFLYSLPNSDTLHADVDRLGQHQLGLSAERPRHNQGHCCRDQDKRDWANLLFRFHLLFLQHRQAGVDLLLPARLIPGAQSCFAHNLALRIYKIGSRHHRNLLHQKFHQVRVRHQMAVGSAGQLDNLFCQVDPFLHRLALDVGDIGADADDLYVVIPRSVFAGKLRQLRHLAQTRVAEGGPNINHGQIVVLKNTAVHLVAVQIGQRKRLKNVPAFLLLRLCLLLLLVSGKLYRLLLDCLLLAAACRHACR